MKKIYLLVFISLTTIFSTKSQGLCPYLGPDQFLPCAVGSTTLTADFSNCPGGGPAPNSTSTYTVANIPFNPVPVGGTPLTMSDDSQQGPFPIGFSFCFFGNTYTQFYIGSNGWISFSAGQPTTFTSSPIPNAGASFPKNCVMGPWQDWHPGTGSGSPYIRYQTLGTAPCRKLVVSWTNVPMFSCTSTLGTFQIILYESTNEIENHLTNKPNCISWAGGTAVQGLHNQTGTTAIVVPGRNSTQWTATNHAVRYTPSGPPVSGTLTWYQVGNPIPIGTGNSITVTPPSAGASYTCHLEYGACYQGYNTCMGYTGSNGPDTVFVMPGPPFITPLITGPYDFCPNTSITVSTDQPYMSYQWSDGSTLPTFSTSTPGPVSVSVVDFNGCTGTANAVLNMLPNPLIQVNPVDPYICPGESVQLTASGAQTYTWTPAIYLDNSSSATVHASPPSDIQYTIIGTDAFGCTDSITNTVHVYPASSVLVTSATPGVCSGFSTQLQANGAASYSWLPPTGLNDAQISNPTATITQTQTWDVVGTDVNGCQDTASITLLAYPIPQAAFSAPILNGCAPVAFTLNDLSSISSGSIVAYQWNVINNNIYTQSNPTFSINTPGTYDIQLIVSSDHGCADTAFAAGYLEVYSVPIAGFYANPQPATTDYSLITFTNTSTPNAIYFQWDMDGLYYTSATNPSYEFGFADTFMITLIATTIHGCSDTVISPVIIDDISQVFIPNSFTPNGDEKNESWFPIGRNLHNQVVSIDVQVFNRWGQIVFESNDVAKPWYATNGPDGDICPQGIYAYSVTFTNEKGKVFRYKGHITLIR